MTREGVGNDGVGGRAAGLVPAVRVGGDKPRRSRVVVPFGPVGSGARGAVVLGEIATLPPAWQTAKSLPGNDIPGEFATLPTGRPPRGWPTYDRAGSDSSKRA